MDICARMRHGVFQAAIHLYTPDNDYVVGAMVTHQVGSLGRAAVLHLLPETLISNFFFFFLFFSYFTTSVVFCWKNAKKEETNVAVLYTFLTFQEPQFVLML